MQGGNGYGYGVRVRGTGAGVQGVQDKKLKKTEGTRKKSTPPIKKKSVY